MSVVGMVQMRPHDVVVVVAVGNALVAAVGPVGVVAVVLGAFVRGRALRRIGRAHCQPMLVDVIAVDVVQMTIVHVVDVPFVLDGRMSTTTTVLVTVLGMLLTCHVAPPFVAAPIAADPL
ncbi:MAG TPA: hypothetical protein VHV78_10145 [Gemmatimonadaceae bacterium]|nr:hypothetical protein [Gemmatimonadaceae bacterium]